MIKKYARILLILLAITGIGFMSYLTYLHFAPDSSSFCDVGEKLSCSTVNTSQYSKVMGIPFSILGVLYFTGVLGMAIFQYNKKNLKYFLIATIVFLGPSFYLTGIELFVLDTICLFCEGSKLVMLAIVGVSWAAVGKKEFPMNVFVVALIGAILAGGFTFLMHANQGPGDKYIEFMECLDEKGFVMYGSETCQYCAKQRAVLGEEAFEEHIEEIECDPRNPGNVAELCIEKNIEATPTWIQEDEDGNELYRFPAGVQKLEKLSEVSGCELPEE
ncbi:MAG: vitamin K epoxide reductase family protein [Candidatus Spechtbacterales bacterium]|nr:vitamin K epoxide reductase family protein [Candidatus Spechtbacterales bacterium]